MTLTDDLDGTKAEQTVTFGLDGCLYEIELSKKNLAALGKSLQPYMDTGRKVRATSTGARRSAPASRRRSRHDLADVRAWAKSEGMEVSERGRIAQTVQDAYDAAH